MMKMNLDAIAVDDFFRRPLDRNAGALRRHYHNVTIWAALQIPDIAIVRKNFRPQLQVGSGFEDRHLGRAHQD